MKDTEIETRKHITRVMGLVNTVVNELQARALNHDRSKLESPEKECKVKLDAE